MASCLDDRRWMPSWQLAFVMAAVGCGPVVAEPDAAESGTSVDTSGPVTASTSTETTTTASTSTTNTTSSSSSPSTIGDESEASTAGWPGLPDAGPLYHCDVWAQNCPDGQKCLAFGWDAENIWDATRCWPVADAPGQLGDPCTVEESSFSGIDDCDFGLMCFFVTPDALTGICVQQCGGSSSDPTCAPPDTTCFVTNDAPLALCLPNCDPLDQSCGEGAACVLSDLDLVCFPVTSDGGEMGEACEHINDCNDGLLCISSEYSVDCDASGCCAPFCDLSIEEPDLACPLHDLGERCFPLFADPPPPEHADVGACVLPPP